MRVYLVPTISVGGCEDIYYTSDSTIIIGITPRLGEVYKEEMVS